MRKSLLLTMAGLGYWLYQRNKGVQIGHTGRYVPPESPPEMDRVVASRDYGIGAPGEGAPDAAASNL